MTSDDTTRRPQHSQVAASRIFGDETVIISPGENVVRMLNPTASRIWELSDGKHTLHEIAVELTAEFNVEFSQASRSVDSFVYELIQRGLLVWSSE